MPELTPAEQMLLDGLCYVLVDLSETDPVFSVVGIFSTPLRAIDFTLTDPKTWHTAGEHRWEESGRWEVVPFVMNSARKWAKAERSAEMKERRLARFRGDEVRALIQTHRIEDEVIAAAVDGRVGHGAESMGAGVCPKCSGVGMTMLKRGDRLVYGKCPLCKGHV